MARARKNIVATVIFAVLIASCATAEQTSSVKPAQEKTLQPPNSRELADAGVPPTEDQCGASKMQSLIGKKRSAIPQTPAGANWRVTCSGCAVTLDYRPDRLNIRYNDKTEIVEEVKCG